MIYIQNPGGQLLTKWEMFFIIWKACYYRPYLDIYIEPIFDDIGRYGITKVEPLELL